MAPLGSKAVPVECATTTGLMARRRSVQELEAAEEASALAAVAAALERERQEGARLDCVGPAPRAVVAGEARVAGAEQLDFRTMPMPRRSLDEHEAVHNEPRASSGQLGTTLPGVDVATSILQHSEGEEFEEGLDALREAGTGGAAQTVELASVRNRASNAAGLGTCPGSVKTQGHSLEQVDGHRRGQEDAGVHHNSKEVVRVEEKAPALRPISEEMDTNQAQLPIKAVRKKPGRKKAVKDEEGAKEGGSEQDGFLPGLQEGERCCKSNNRSWRCSRTRHPGSRYCIYHIRDYVDGKLIPRKNRPAAEDPRSAISNDACDPNRHRRIARGRRLLQEARPAASNGLSFMESYEMDHYPHSEGSEEDALDPQRGLSQQHLPMKKRFAAAMSSGGEHAAPYAMGLLCSSDERELAEWALAHKYRESEPAAPSAAQPGIKQESTFEQETGELEAGHAPVKGTLGELPDAFLRAQQREYARLKAMADVNMREHAYRPESSTSPKSESLKRVGMIVEALAGGLDNFEEGGEQNGAAPAGKVEAEAEQAKGEFKRCIMSGGTGWKCGRPRIEESKYCQYHFELRRKQRQNSGARTPKGPGRGKPAQELKQSPREGKAKRPGGRKRKQEEPESEPFPFLSVEFRLQKRTRTKKAVRSHTAVDRLLLAAKVHREDSLEALPDPQGARQHLRCFQVKVSDLAAAGFSDMDEDEAGAHEALTQMLAASTHQGPSSSDVQKEKDNGPERSTAACAELDKKDSVDEAGAKATSPQKPALTAAPSAAHHALKRLVAAEGAGESDGAEPERSRLEVHESGRLVLELQSAEEARVRLEEQGAQTARELQQELAIRAKMELMQAEPSAVGALQAEAAALRRELGEERAMNGALRKQIRQLNEQLQAQEAQFLKHQADLEVLEGEHKQLEAGIAALSVEKHSLQNELSLYRKANTCLLCHTLTANTALEPCGCRLCSSCLMLPPATRQSNGASDRHSIMGVHCPACKGAISGSLKLFKPTVLGAETCYRSR